MLPHWEWTRARTGLTVRPQLNLEAGMKSQDETLEEWCRLLLRAFELEDVQVDVNEVLSLAGVAAHSVVRPAAPLTTFIAGFAAGLASGAGQASDATSMKSALDVARTVSKAYSADDAGENSAPPAAGTSGGASSPTGTSPTGMPGE
jgi:hypothetical protein